MAYTLEQARAAADRAQYISLPYSGTNLRIMWRWADQFGVRSDETGAQLAFTYEQAVELDIMFLVLCPLDLSVL